MVKTRILIGSTLTLLLLGSVALDESLHRAWTGTLILALVTAQALGELWGFFVAGNSKRVLWLQVGILVLFFGRCGEILPSVFTETGSALALLLLLLVGLGREMLLFQYQPESDERKHLESSAALALLLFYVAFPMLLLHEMMLEQPAGRGTRLAAAMVLLSKCGDIGGYLAGTFFGRHRVLPRVSPKKSWEGSIAGLLLTFGFVGALLYWQPDLLPRRDLAFCGILALAINLATQIGDFAESMLKRACGVKDSARLLPTFGGAMDIIDSLVFAMPVTHIVLRLA